MRKHILLGQRGTTFLTTMICSFLMVLVGGSLYQMTASDLHYVNRLKKSLGAQQLADAGLAGKLSALNSNWSSAVGSTLSGNLGQGSYSAAVTQSSGKYLVSSTGTVQGVQRTASAEVLPASSSVFDYAIASGGNMTLNSGTSNSPGTVTGDVYSGGNLAMDGGTGGSMMTITGDVQATGNISTNSTVAVSGSTTANYGTSLDFPVPDLASYRAIAQANGTYYSGNKTYSNSNPLPSAGAGGVLYIGGNVTIHGTQTITGCLVVTGNLTIKKSGGTYPQITINQFGNYPALINAGNFGFTSSGNGGAFFTANGLVYVSGNATFGGNHVNVTVNGCIEDRGNLSISPSSDTNFTINFASQNPPYFDEGGGGSSTMEILSYNR